MRYMLKGGVWKNAEDEILKAAVMKYGLNQWSRISSLMVRKSAKQCKARWYEWLDPSIKKIDWTKEEEEKLLHLAKIFPCQWRTIAPIVGRTPNQCVEHYEKLLQQAQGREGDIELRKLKPGEIDPNPENKPAKPDEIDMDEDMKEMLAEARVRLANTKGKKAKRKAREKIIEEARRLALMQKKREMKAAGIDYIMTKRDKIRDRKWKKVMNYNKEIPFERQVPEFRYAHPQHENPIAGGDVGNISLQTLEGPRRDEEEEKLRKIDQKKMKKLKERDMTTAIEKINRLNKIHKESGSRMVLPQPQLQDRDLELLGKLSRGRESQQIEGWEGTKASQLLVNNYGEDDGIMMGMMSVQRTPLAINSILQQVRTVQSIIESTTPLLGSTHLQKQQQQSQNFSSTPFSSLLTPSHTPFRKQQDLLGINKVINQNNNNQSLFQSSDHQWDQNYENINIKHQLTLIPQPINTYQIEIPEFIQDSQKSNNKVQDKENLQIQDQIKKKIKLQKQEEKKTLAILKNLPRPSKINLNYDLKDYNEEFEVENLLVNNQLIHLIAYDSVNYPIQGQEPEMKILVETKELERINKGLDLKYLNQASQLIYNEIKTIYKEKKISAHEILKSIEKEHQYQEIIFNPFLQQFEYKNKIYNLKSVLTWQIENSLLQLKQEQMNVDKVQQKINNILGGFNKEFKSLTGQINKLSEMKLETLQQLIVFKEMLSQEEEAIINRSQLLKQTTLRLNEKENKLQEKYCELYEKREKLIDTRK